MAFICLAVIICYLLFFSYKNKLYAIIKLLPKSMVLLISAISIGSILWAGIWLFNLKKLSAIGRLLSINISLYHITDHFWLGTGLGRFAWYYPQWQATYFNAHTRPPLAYFLSAGESYIVFNAYFQLFETIGLLGFLFCIYGLYRFFKVKAINRRSLLMVVKCAVLAILCSGFTSYPLHVNVILLLLGACLAIGFPINDKSIVLPVRKQWLYINKTLIVLCFLLVCCVFYKGYSAYNAVNKWADLRDGSSSKIIAESIYPILKNDGKFLTEYGTLLLSDSSNKFTAINILEKAKQLLITRQGVEALVTAYSNVKRYKPAIINQQFLVNYLPNKFLQKDNLLQLYVFVNDSSKIKQIGKTILQMPVKIPSFEVEKIKQNTRVILKEYDNDGLL